jgi:predicted  nucleic acid-binding Zn-ribbon protein
MPKPSEATLAQKVVQETLAQKIIQEIASELAAAREDRDAARRDLQGRLDLINEEAAGVLRDVRDAEADLRVVQRLEGRLARAVYDARRRDAQRAFDTANAALAARRTQAQNELAPLQEKLRTLEKRVLDLEAEEKAHARIAKHLAA